MKRLVFLIAVFVCGACSSSKEYVQNPVDTLIKQMDAQEDFTIILYDMAEESGLFSSTYKHMYKVVKPGKDDEGKPESALTDWKEVSKDFFALHESDMGMEIASKAAGKLSKQTAPPGYSNYVGNKQYGQWETRSDGSSFWAFYGQYAFMSSMLGLVAGPIHRSSYTDYNRNYRGTNRPYYGKTSAGKPAYGTYSSAALKQNPKSAFAGKVQSRVSKSASSSKSRSGSRYNSGSSSRGRSSGGK